MNRPTRTRMLGGALLAALSGVGVAWGAPQEEGGLVRITRVEPWEDLSELGDAATWRARLLAEDLDGRERDFARLVAVAGRDPRAWLWLKRWAAGGEGETLAWTARLALREVQRTAARPLGESSWGADAPPSSARAPDRAPEWGGDGPRVFHADLEQLRERMTLLERRLVEAEARRPSASADPAAARGPQITGFVELQIGAELVKCRITEQVGNETTETDFEAPNLVALFLEHPELVAPLGASIEELPILELGQRPPGFGRAYLQQLGKGAARGVSGGIRTDVLGVVVAAPPRNDPRRSGLTAGVGLIVQRTQPGTIAQTLGIKRGNVLVEINRRQLTAADVISEILCNRLESDPLELTFIDNWGQHRTRIWRPIPTAEAAEPPVKGAKPPVKGAKPKAKDAGEQPPG